MGLPAIFKSINDRIHINRIKDNLTTTEKGNVLDASQGKILYDKINDLLSQQSIKTYTSLEQINLTDADF